MDTCLIRTPPYYKQFALSLEWGKKALTFFLQSTRFIQTPHYWKQFALSLGKESPYILSTLNPLNTDTPFIRKLSRVSSVSVLMGFILTVPEVPVKMFLQPNWQIKQFFF